MVTLLLAGCASKQYISDLKETISTRPQTINLNLEFEITAGKSHNYPSFAIWVEDLEGNYIETLF